jgi:hypothetical protein
MTVRIGWVSPEPGGTRVFHFFIWRKVTDKVAKTRFLGYHRYNRRQLVELRDQGIREHVDAIGIVSFTRDVSPALFDAVFESFNVRGWVRNKPVRLSARPLP